MAREIPLVTKAIDSLTGRVVSSESLTYEQARNYLATFKRCEGESNYSFLSIGAPIRTYATVSGISGIKALDYTLNWLEKSDQLGEKHKIRESALPVFKVKIRKKNGRWFHAELCSRINVLAGHSNHEITLDFFEKSK